MADDQYFGEYTYTYPWQAASMNVWISAQYQQCYAQCMMSAGQREKTTSSSLYMWWIC